ncbi:MAG: S-adenosylmethionine decarboxylase [Candidatus Caenarcaniphilales bacterium]|nr:S-adenosylmethionine decarboxylase [Candidatus Caenarcaniphilales bacterium]
MFGPHLVMEAYGCERGLMTDIEAMIDLLDRLPSKMDMTKIMPPYAFKYSGKVEEEWGLSGVVLIAESHIALHTFPDKNGFLTVDIFSCKDFCIETAIEEIVKVYNPTHWDHQLFMRGREYPRSIAKAGEIIETERLQCAQNIPHLEKSFALQ